MRILTKMRIHEYTLLRIYIIVTQTLINKYNRYNNAYSQ